MIRKLLLLVLLWLLVAQLFAQVKTADITIARDSFGVPHIFAPTDAQAAYGLAWAHCEDDFEHIQQNLLAAKGMLGEVLGKEGVLFDFAIQFFSIDTFVRAHYESDLSADFQAVLSGYVQGVNDYARLHPEEVLLKKGLPFTEQEVMRGYMLNLTLMAGSGMALKAIREDRIHEFYAPNETGSNAMAIGPSKTEDGKVWLLINSHQPLEGRFAWWEAHVQSGEGWDIIGGLFPGGATIFVGTNRNLGWAHTTNYHSFGDVYQLQVKGNKYKYNGEWKVFSVRKAKLKIKLGALKVSVSKKLYDCDYGPVFKTKKGWYALRFPGYTDLRAGEQWYRMNKAANWREFENATRMQAIPLFNTVYGDRDGNIFWQSAGRVPLRNTKLDWTQPITANTADYRWTSLVPYEKMPALLNPKCAFVFSCNQSPFMTSGKSCNWDGDKFTGIQRFDYNRGERYNELLNAIQGKLSWQDFLRIKFDAHYSTSGSYAKRFKALYDLKEQDYPELYDAIRAMNSWNKDGSADNKEANLAMVAHWKLQQKYNMPFALLMIREQQLTEKEVVWALTEAKKFLMKTHGSISVPLGDVQRLVRGNVSLPASGLSEVSRAADPKLWDKKQGLFRIVSGDGYMQLVKFGRIDEPEILSISPYGASAKPGSKHYTDQMEMFTRHEFKRMTFDRAEILRKAERVYSPGQ